MNATTTWFCAPFVLPTRLQSLMSIIVELAASATTIAVIQFPNLHKKYPTADSRFKIGKFRLNSILCSIYHLLESKIRAFRNKVQVIVYKTGLLISFNPRYEVLERSAYIYKHASNEKSYCDTDQYHRERDEVWRAKLDMLFKNNTLNAQQPSISVLMATNLSLAIATHTVGSTVKSKTNFSIGEWRKTLKLVNQVWIRCRVTEGEKLGEKKTR
ncbi:hypothetical protein GQX74_008915 [Glossina fuscipes]|nr:hypothetical protein GQX74_008915 [Glossina fuscipes]